MSLQWKNIYGVKQRDTDLKGRYDPVHKICYFILLDLGSILVPDPEYIPAEYIWISSLFVVTEKKDKLILGYITSFG